LGTAYSEKAIKSTSASRPIKLQARGRKARTVWGKSEEVGNPVVEKGTSNGVDFGGQSISLARESRPGQRRGISTGQYRGNVRRSERMGKKNLEGLPVI